MAKYFLIDEAKVDLNDIKKFSVKNWGRDIAREYFNGLTTIFRLLAAQPELGLNCSDDLGEGYLSYVHKSHIIYYKAVGSDRIIIAAILHHSMLPEKHLRRRATDVEREREQNR